LFRLGRKGGKLCRQLDNGQPFCVDKTVAPKTTGGSDLLAQPIVIIRLAAELIKYLPLGNYLISNSPRSQARLILTTSAQKFSSLTEF